MNFEVEYPVVVYGRPKRATNEKLILARDTVHVEIPEFSSSELLKAIDLTADFGDGPLSISYDTLEGGLYVRVGNDAPEAGLNCYRFRSEFPNFAPFVGAAHAAAEIKLDIDRRWREATIYPPAVAEAVRYPKDRKHIVPPTLDEVRGELNEVTVARARADFVAHMERFILVDGMLMRQEPEPIIIVTVDKYASNRVTLQALRRDAGEPNFASYAQDCIPAAVFRLDQWAEADEYARELILLSEETSAPELRNFLTSSVVHDSRLLVYDERAATVRSICEWAYAKTSYLRSCPEDSPIHGIHQALSQNLHLKPDQADPVLADVVSSLRSLQEKVSCPSDGNLFTGYGHELMAAFWSRLDDADIVFEP